MQNDDKQHRAILQKIAHKALLQRGLLPDFSAEVLVELGRIQAPAAIDGERVHDLRSLLWASIDNDDSLDLTSRNFNEDRLAIVVEMVIGADGFLIDSDIYRASVRNHAKLAYNSVAAWLEGTGTVPEAVAAVNGLEETLRLQDKAAQGMKNLRHVNGALSFETVEARPVFDGDEIRDT